MYNYDPKCFISDRVCRHLFTDSFVYTFREVDVTFPYTFNAPKPAAVNTISGPVCISCILYMGMLFSLNAMPYLSVNVFINGLHSSGLMGANTPFSLIVPSSTNCTATAHGTPTNLAIAEYPPISP
jgi:hypothetical protein